MGLKIMGHGLMDHTIPIDDLQSSTKTILKKSGCPKFCHHLMTSQPHIMDTYSILYVNLLMLHLH